jgi:haloalkane dehalogenase
VTEQASRSASTGPAATKTGRVQSPTRTFVLPLTLADLRESLHAMLAAVRSDEGRRMVLDGNIFVERMMLAVTRRRLTDEETAEYRRPCPNHGEDRAATLQ